MLTNGEDVVRGKWSRLTYWSGVGVATMERVDTESLIDHATSVKEDQSSR